MCGGIIIGIGVVVAGLIAIDIRIVAAFSSRRLLCHPIVTAAAAAPTAVVYVLRPLFLLLLLLACRRRRRCVDDTAAALTVVTVAMEKMKVGVPTAARVTRHCRRRCEMVVLLLKVSSLPDSMIIISSPSSSLNLGEKQQVGLGPDRGHC